MKIKIKETGKVVDVDSATAAHMVPAHAEVVPESEKDAKPEKKPARGPNS